MRVAACSSFNGHGSRYIVLRLCVRCVVFMFLVLHCVTRLHVACCVLRVACCVLRVARCALRVARCVLCVACCVLCVVW
jgi:hypothetical protein